MLSARKEDGAVLVEFTLVLPLLLLLIFGFLQFGLAMNAKIDATHLTATGARYITVNQNPALTAGPELVPKTMENYIRSRGDTVKVRTARVRICYPLNTATGTKGKVGDPVRVLLDQVTYLSLVGSLPWFGGTLSLPSLAIASEATMRLEALPTKIPESAGCP